MPFYEVENFLFLNFFKNFFKKIEFLKLLKVNFFEES